MNNSEISFFKKYKPNVIEDFLFDGDLEKILYFFLEANELNMFIHGSAGCGKTSIIRVLINHYYKLNELATQEKNEILQKNVFYINSLSEYGINFFRNEVKTFCKIPSFLTNKKKIVVIDDIDNINEQSQQVLRNYISEYKHNIFFMASCTNIQKIISNLQSRLNIISIPHMTNEKLKIHSEKIIKYENLVIDEESKNFLLKISNYSLRILITYLEKIYLLDEPINIKICKNICTNIDYSILSDYTCEIFEKRNIENAIYIIKSIFEKGYSVIDIFETYFLYIKNTTILNENLKYNIIKIITKYISYFYTKHEDEIELYLFTNNIYNLI